MFLPAGAQAPRAQGFGSEVSGVEPEGVFPLRPWRLSPAACAAVALLIAGATGLPGVHVNASLSSPWGDAPIPRLLLSTLLGLAAALVVLRQLLALRAGPRSIALDAAGLRLPRGAEPWRSRRIAWSELDGVEIARALGHRVLVAGRGRRWPLLVSERAVARPGDLDRLHAALHARIAPAPAAQPRTAGGVPRVALAALLLLPAVHAVAAAVGVPGSFTSDVALGAEVPALVRAGELWRLLSAQLLHDGAGHLLRNAAVIGVLGWRLERHLGASRTLLIGAAGALAGAVAFLGLATHDLWRMLGASGFAFGLFGGYALLRLRAGAALPPVERSRPVGILTFGLLLLALASDVGTVRALHGIALLAGAAAAAVLFRHPARPRPPSAALRAAAAACAGLLALGALAFVRAAAGGVGELDLALLRDGTRRMADDRLALNALAWELAIDPLASPAALALARDAAERASALDPENPAFRDTLATCLYRLGDAEAAAEIARGLLDDVESPAELRFRASQLARFEAARLAAAPAPAPATLALAGGDAVVLRGHPVSGGGLRAYALLWQDGRLLGLLRLHAGVAGAEEIRAAAPLAVAHLLRAADAIQVARIAPGADGAGARVEAWEMEPAVARLP
jgi:rhomboid protease GluP